MAAAKPPPIVRARETFLMVVTVLVALGLLCATVAVVVDAYR